MSDPDIHRCEDNASRIAALQAVLDAAQRELLFYAPRFDGHLIEDAGVQRRLQAFLLASPRHTLRFLVVEAAALVRDCPRLLALCRRLPSRCQLRIPGPHAEALDEALYCADSHHALHRPPTERTLHLHLAGQPLKVSPLRKRVEALWDDARESEEFRQLSI
jgi:hypothetical protein